MTELKTAQHVSFTIDREYNATPAQVFRAFADADAKQKWFAGPPDQWTELERTFDFRVGGRERARGAWPRGDTSDFQAVYLDIVDDARIIYAYDMYVNDRKISVSLATIEVTGAAFGARLTFTEQAVFLDGYPTPEDREAGTRQLLEQLGRYLS